LNDYLRTIAPPSSTPPRGEGAPADSKIIIEKICYNKVTADTTTEIQEFIPDENTLPGDKKVGLDVYEAFKEIIKNKIIIEKNLPTDTDLDLTIIDLTNGSDTPKVKWIFTYFNVVISDSSQPSAETVVTIPSGETDFSTKDDLLKNPVIRNLMWNNNSCFMDVVIVNFFTLDSPISRFLLNNFEKIKTTNSEFFDFFKNLFANDNIKKYLRPADNINKFNDILNLDNCSGLAEYVKQQCKDIFKGSSGGNVNLFMYKLIKFLDTDQAFNETLKYWNFRITQADVSEKPNIQEVIQSLPNDQKLTDNSIKLNFTDNPGEDKYLLVYAGGENIFIGKNINYLKEFTDNGNNYYLASAIVGNPGHYFSIIGDGIGKYFLVDKLGTNKIEKLNLDTNYDWFKYLSSVIYYKEPIPFKIFTNYDKYFPSGVASPLKLKNPKSKHLSPTYKIRRERKKRRKNIHNYKKNLKK